MSFSNGKTNYSSHVRFTKNEYEKILKIKQITGLSVPKILKEALFSKEFSAPLMDFESAHSFLRELNRIGNNFNQVAKHLNAGLREGFNPRIDEIASDLKSIRRLLEVRYGNR